MVQTAKKYYTFEDYLNYEDDTDYKYELVNGELIQMPVASGIHALILSLIYDFLKAEILRLNLDWLIMPGTLGVRTTGTKSRIPDLSIITRKQAEEIRTLRSAVLQESPLLVIEIASPGNSDDDYRYKRSEYAALEIPEYWIIDPSSQKISVLTLINGFYEVAEFTSDIPIISPTFPELNLNVTQIFNL